MISLNNLFSPTINVRDFTPEQKLWRAVLAQALYDALSHFENKFTTKEEKEEAEKWFIDDNYDFNSVVEYAGFDPSYLRKKFKKTLNLKKLKKLGIVWNHGGFRKTI